MLTSGSVFGSFVMMHRLLSLLIFAALTAEAVSAAGKMRRWTDTEGRKVVARLTGFSSADRMVRLELEDGREVRFSIELLGPRDRAYVRENAPIDLRTASREIDQILWEGLVAANRSIKEEKARLIRNVEMPPAERNQEMARLIHRERLTHPTEPLDNERFLRRVYLDIAGRIPTYEEAQRFLRPSPGQAEREELIDELLDSEAFVSHFFNYLGDLLRIRDGISMGGFDNLKAEAYSDWVKDQIRRDRPWDEFVTDLLAAEGHFWDNPATGYLLTDYGMELCNLSNTFTTFAGTEITCAQCHDHPFEDVYQIDFYRMAAFFGHLRFEEREGQPALSAIEAKKKEFAAAAKKEERDLGDLNTILGAYRIRLTDGSETSTQLPFDYQYDNGEPHQRVRPGVYFGDIVDLEEAPTPRAAFAEWLTSEGNPRFTINIVNRLWKHVFGIAQIEPVDNIPGHLDGQAQNYELLKFLENLMKEVDYSVRDFLRVLYKTRTYQREACYRSPTLTMIDRGEFHFPAPVLRRLSAEQLWDSLVAMSVEEPEAAERRTRILEGYQELMNVDWSTMTYPAALEWTKRYDQLGKSGSMMAANRDRRGRTPAPAVMKRASELPQPGPVGSFLHSFGQSDKKFIENSSRDGTIPQVMLLLNGSLTNRAMAESSQAMVRHAREERDPDEGARVIFLSVLTRYPAPQEREDVENLVRSGPGGTDYSDLIWALLNTREFLFIQ